jgi:hypothetical protein
MYVQWFFFEKKGKEERLSKREWNRRELFSARQIETKINKNDNYPNRHIHTLINTHSILVLLAYNHFGVM